MVIDKKGKIFEDRRKQPEDRRENDFDTKGGRRQKDRRKTPEQPPETDKNKK